MSPVVVKPVRGGDVARGSWSKQVRHNSVFQQPVRPAAASKVTLLVGAKGMATQGGVCPSNDSSDGWLSYAILLIVAFREGEEDAEQ